ncbi:MAG: YicC/YloC family endoribonuclease [Steroidobacteraceae bacterium]
MTGFARREATDRFGTLACELRSVNHRYLEISLRLPEELRSLEPQLRSRLGAKLKRGKIDCSLHLKRGSGAAASQGVDAATLDAIIRQVTEIASRLPAPQTRIDAMDVLRFPGVIREDESAVDRLRASFDELFEATLDELVAARQREGEHLRGAILQRCEALSELAAGVEQRLPQLRQEQLQRLRERVAELAAEVNAERLEQEIALVVARSDVAEEIDRLRGHVAEVRRVVSAGEPAGRRLDFLMQELNREANTLSSKSPDLELTRCAVEMKVAIEQMREQVQNIE